MAVTTEITTDATPARARFVAARLLVAGDAFFFLGFLFAYLYLRALDSNGRWHPAHIDPSIALGTVAVVAVVAAGLTMQLLSGRSQRQAAAVSLALVLVATVCWGIQLFNPGFSPSHGGGYGAVFVGFSAAMLAHMLGAAYWLETIAVDSSASSDQLVNETRAATVFVSFLTGVAVIAYILIYLV